MKKSGKINEEEVISEKFFEDDPEEGPQQDFDCLRSGWTWRFYKAFDWRELWDEFCTATLPDGRLTYRTAWMFCKAKTKVRRERHLMYEIIGPKPILEKGQKLRAPWLGDWHKRRKNTFWSDEDPTKFLAVKRAMKERASKLEAMQAIGPLTLKWMQRIEALAEKVDAAFAGNPLDPKYPPTHPKNINRIKFYMQWMQDVFRMNKRAWQAWLISNGVGPTAIESYTEMAMQPGQPALPAGNGQGIIQANGQSIQLPEGFTIDHMLAAFNLKKKTEMFGMDLGTEYTTIEGEVEKKDKSNGRPH